MLWYTGYIARYNLKKASCRFIKEQWHFKGKPLLVVLNSQGQVECENAMHMIRVYGVESFPFTRGAEETLLKEKCWIEFVIIHIKPRDTKMEKATLVQNDILLKEKGISIELVAVEKEKLNVFELCFWTSIESMFISKAQWKTETDDVGQEIQKLFSYKNESAWTVFTNGSSVLVSVSGKTVLKALEDFDTWKGAICMRMTLKLLSKSAMTGLQLRCFTSAPALIFHSPLG
uniref:Sieve element occlusion C-terminal domain-containing protein n=1 Tax=Fagus sylvatica TaxID=28930 RepID=A0A2N9I4J2_FAGSY